MAPSVSDKPAVVETITDTIKDLKLSGAGNASLEKEDSADGPLYPGYYPYSDASETFPPTQLFDHTEAGLRADPALPNLLGNATTRHISPYIGTEVNGVQISKLSKEGLDELALYAAQRKLLVFRDQDFKDIGYEKQIEIAKHFGQIQRHPTSGNVKGYPEFHVVYRDFKNDRFRDYRGTNRLSRTDWHSDISYEKQPPGTTLFWILEQPELGGDTLFLSQVEAYKRLSDEFKKRLIGLRAVHSAVYQADHSRQRGGPVRREPVETEHPIVRVHPVTGEKALYVNPGFTRYIVGFKQEESDYLLNFLYGTVTSGTKATVARHKDHLAKGSDFQIRASYEPGTVVVWDNRVTCHSATPDYDVSEERRHAVRLTPQAEVPIPATE